MAQFLVGKLFENENETITYSLSFFMLIHNLFSKLVRNQLFYHIIFISELSKPESVCSMYPQGVGKNASFTKSAVIRDFFLSPWVNSLHTQPNDSFAV
jgi:hypothetical protein